MSLKLVKLINDKQLIIEIQKAKGLKPIDLEKYHGRIGKIYSMNHNQAVTVQYTINSDITNIIVDRCLLVDKLASTTTDYTETDSSNECDKKAKNLSLPTKTVLDTNRVTELKFEDLIKAIQDKNIIDISDLCKDNKHINDFDSKHQNAFHCASYFGEVHKMRILDKFGVNVMAVDNEGDTCLHIAIFGMRYRAIVYLCENHKELLVKKNLRSETPLLLAARINVDKIFLKVLENNTNVIDCQDQNRNGILHHLVMKNNFKLFQRMLTCENIKLNNLNNDGMSPFHLACSLGHKEIIEILIKYCTKMKDFSVFNQINQNNETGVQLAIRYKFYDLALYLMRSVRVKWSKHPLSANHGSILHCAVKEAHLTLVESILKADNTIIDLKTADGKSALDLALEMYKIGLRDNYIQGRDIAKFLYLKNSRTILKENREVLNSIVRTIS